MFQVIVHQQDRLHQLEAPAGTQLRDLLLAHGISPYGSISQHLNCGGRGLCATCGVELLGQNSPSPSHWHDKLAHHWGYPRLSCQITIDRDLEVRILSEKKMWGRLKKR